MAEASKTCILIPTFAAYLPVALVTRSLLSRFWPRHPPVFFAGLHQAPSHEPLLPLRSDIVDWCSIVADACDDLRKLGFTSLYLVLDDHPPLNPCHDYHLNTTLPALLEKLDAAYIGLNGWGYGRAGRKVTGTIYPRQYWNMEHVDDAFAWRFSLHPGLWSVEHLGTLARGVEALNPSGRRTAWNFERTVNKSDSGLDLANCCYRVSGPRMTASPARYLRYRTAYLSILLYKRLRSLLGGPAATDDPAVNAIGYYYEGPYPLFWSGLIVQGRLNPALMRYITIARRRDLGELMTAEAMKPFSVSSSAP